MNTKFITSLQELASYRDDWDRILIASQNDNPFIEYEWIAHWWEFLGREYQMVIGMVEQDGEIIGFLPLMKKTGRFVDYFKFIGYGQSNYMDVIATSKWRKATIICGLEAYLKQNPSAIFMLHGFLESKGTVEVFKQILKDKKKQFHTSSVVAPFVNLSEVGNSHYFKKRLKKHGVDRKEKRLKAMAKVRYSTLNANDLVSMFNIHEKRWREKSDTSGFTKGRTQEFFEQLAYLNQSTLKTTIHGMFVEDRLVAFVYGFQCGERYVFYLPGHDDDFGVFSPGKIIFKESILACVKEKISIFDMSIGYEPYKYDWNTDEERVTKIIFPGRSLLSKHSFFYFKNKEALVQRIKKRRSLVLFKRNTLGKWRLEFKKEGVQALLKGVGWFRRYIFDYNQCFVYKKSLVDGSNEYWQTDYQVIQLHDLLRDKAWLTEEHEERIKRLYKKEKGFFRVSGEKGDNLFWVNHKRMALQNIGIEEELPKESLYLSDWHQYEPSIELAVMAEWKQPGMQLYLSDIKSNPHLLVEGFKLVKIYKVLTFFGKRFVKTKGLLEGGDDLIHDQH